MTPGDLQVWPLAERLPHTCPRCRYVGTTTVLFRRDWYLCDRGWTDVYVVCRLSEEPADCVEAPVFLAGMSALVDEAIQLGAVAAPPTTERK